LETSREIQVIVVDATSSNSQKTPLQDAKYLKNNYLWEIGAILNTF
jgi:hypothetical protein